MKIDGNKWKDLVDKIYDTEKTVPIIKPTLTSTDIFEEWQSYIEDSIVYGTSFIKVSEEGTERTWTDPVWGTVRNDGYYYCGLDPALETCTHDFVDVGFMQSKFVCKKCDIEKKD